MLIYKCDWCETTTKLNEDGECPASWQLAISDVGDLCPSCYAKFKASIRDLLKKSFGKKRKAA